MPMIALSARPGREQLFVQVDTEDLPLVSPFRWCADRKPNHVYAARYDCRGDRKKWVLMHRFIMDAPTGVQVDHIDGDTLNNRRSNLRLVTRSGNCQNARLRADNSSGFKGAYYDAHIKWWRARICVDGHDRHLGIFDSAIEAAEAYDKAARELHGPYARLNFPKTGERAAFDRQRKAVAR